VGWCDIENDAATERRADASVSRETAEYEAVSRE
jgi:hypothetical protein